MEKEHKRWDHMAEEARMEAARMEAVHAAGLRGKQNKSSEHFDIITLRYHNTPEGQTLQYKARGHAAARRRFATPRSPFTMPRRATACNAQPWTGPPPPNPHRMR